MTLSIETRITRPGEPQQRLLKEITTDFVVDFDQLGHDSFPTKQWQDHCTRWQISPNQHIVIAEADSVFCSPRLAWMLSNSGFEHVQVALPSQLSEHKVDHQPFEPELINTLVSGGFVGKDYIVKALQQNVQLVDVRSNARFTGEEADPRPNVRAGHIPGSTNIHYSQFLSDDGAKPFKSVDDLRACFTRHSIDLTREVVFSCGSGITACIGAMAAVMCGADDVLVYDGSWKEWGADTALPVATGQ